MFMAENDVYDVIIVGGGPAALAAGLYTARDRYSTLILEKNGMPGGQIMLTERVENYPGYGKISGPDLIYNMSEPVKKFGAEIATSQGVTGIEKPDDGNIKVSVNEGEKTYTARAVILAPGSDYRQLGVDGEEQLRQATKVSYCATCDGAFYKDKNILTVGGGNTAVEDTVYLATKFAKKVTMIHRRKEFRAQQVLVDELYDAAEEHDIDVKLPYILTEIVPNEAGDDIDHVVLKNVETDETEELEVDGVFIFIGMVPNTDFLKGTVELTDNGYIKADPVTMRTSMPGVFVAGDCRTQAAMQLATACADGVVAAIEMKQYFRDPESWSRTGQLPEISGW